MIDPRLPTIGLMLIGIGWVSAIAYFAIDAKIERSVYGMEYFSVFKQLANKHRRVAGIQRQFPDIFDQRTVDPTPVGTIRKQDKSGHNRSTKYPKSQTLAKVPVNQARLMGVFGNQAMISIPGKVLMVRKGDTLKQFGKVLEIGRNRTLWHVVTDQGTISQ